MPNEGHSDGVPPAARALVVTCMDFRFQPMIDAWIARNLGPGRYDRLAWAGGVKDWPQVSRQVQLSKALHDVSEVILMNHEDCGGYGQGSLPRKHAEDLRAARQAILASYPEVQVRLFYLHLDGVFEELT
jgi:carbonic anhydrase